MARTARFYPARAAAQVLWLRNYRNKIGTYKTVPGYSDPEIAAAVADCDRVAWLIETFQGAAQSFAQAATAHLRLVQTGGGAAPVDPPAFTLPTSPAPPANVPPGALKRLMAFIKNLKTRAGYTEPIGEDLQIIGAEEPAPDPLTTKPLIEVVLGTGGRPGVLWKKGDFSGIRIDVDRGDGQGRRFLATDTEPDYVDTVLPAPGTSAVWKYWAIYLDGDEPFGQWSDMVSLAVQG